MKYYIVSEADLNLLGILSIPTDKTLAGRREWRSVFEQCRKMPIPEGTDSLVCFGMNREGMPMKHTILIGDNQQA
jgi:hypothetical protein